MEAANNSDQGMSSVVAFVEGGVQEVCHNSCSICLDEFCANDPSTVTNCRHEFHLQCILEWSQRSSNCPMCWQSISLKDVASQKLLDAIEQDRKLNSISLTNHLVATTSMRRGSHFVREGQRSRSSLRLNRPLFIMTTTRASHDSTVARRGSESTMISIQSPSMRSPNSPSPRELPLSYSPVRHDHIPIDRAGSNVPLASRLELFLESRFTSQSSEPNDDTAGPSDLQSSPDSLLSRFNSWSTRYRESFSRNTKGLKERLFSRSSSSTCLSPALQKEADDVIIGDSGSSNSPSRGNVLNTVQASHTSDSTVPTSAMSLASD